jgi:hypothetical protein
VSGRSGPRSGYARAVWQPRRVLAAPPAAETNKAFLCRQPTFTDPGLHRLSAEFLSVLT